MYKACDKVYFRFLFACLSCFFNFVRAKSNNLEDRKYLRTFVLLPNALFYSVLNEQAAL